MITHLWQSTIFAGLVWCAAVALRHNGARVRYWLWLAASLKFLVPLSWLVMLGAQIEWRTGPVSAQPAAAFVIEQVLAPSAAAPSVVNPTIPHAAPGSSLVPELMVAVWLLGVATVCLWWWRQWTPVREALRGATRLPLESSGLRGLDVMSSPMTMEPGVVGIWRPALLVPEGLLEQLTAAQVDALVAHELSHVRHRDNLTAAVHMAVEALFWFHPLVWWIERRLIDERERACDEDVLRSGSRPSDYAEGILAVCRLSVGAPLACVAGITGSDLRRRIESILLGGLGRPMGAGRRWALALAALVTVGLPIVAGAVNAVPLVTVGQDPSTPVAFAVASIKVNKSGERGSLTSDNPPGVFTGTNVFVAHLIREAYDIQDNQIESAPEWTRNSSGERFDIKAKLEQVPAEGEAQERATRLALQALLAERFNLVVRRETREVPMYALVMARRDGQPGPLLKRSSVDCSPEGREARIAAAKAGKSPGVCGMRVRTGLMQVGGYTMADLAKGMSPYNGRSLIDRTGLTGAWEFELTFMPDQPGPPPEPGREPPPAIDPNAPPLLTAMQEQLGLKLESTRGTMEVLIVERVERPSEN